MFGDAEIPEMMADAGVPVTFGGITANGLYRRRTAVVLEDEVQGTNEVGETVLLQRTAFPALEPEAEPINEPITVDGQEYRVADVLEENQLLVRVVLAAP
jgi:hypothetical protein